MYVMFGVPSGAQVANGDGMTPRKHDMIDSSATGSVTAPHPPSARGSGRRARAPSDGGQLRLDRAPSSPRRQPDLLGLARKRVGVPLDVGQLLRRRLAQIERPPPQPDRPVAPWAAAGHRRAP